MYYHVKKEASELCFGMEVSMKKRVILNSMVGFLMGCFICTTPVKAAELQETTTPETETGIEVSTPYFDYGVLELKKNNITWKDYSKVNVGSGQTLTYTIECADNEKFENAKSWETEKTAVTLEKSVFGKNGGTFYFRLKARVKDSAGTVTDSPWSETKKASLYAINKKNFPGIYKLLKKGGKSDTFDGVKDIIYDKNKDGWLDEAEIQDVLQIATVNITKKKNGVYHSKPYLKLSSLKGIELLPNVLSIDLSHYSGSKIDVSKNKLHSLWVSGITSKKIIVNAPTAENIHIESHFSKKLKKMDLSACKNAVSIDAYGSMKTKNVKLPKEKKNLKVLSISDATFGTLNVNKYKNLQQLYIYNSNVKKLKISKCKELRYLYFYFTKKIKSVNAKANKKLRGIDIYSTPTLTRSNVKYGKKTKATWQKGKWWYSTKAYKKDMKKLYK